ncbi:extracellular cell wall glucanase Crf1 [Stachybotrys elegans]|uniref:chitinase n=1 Tax=Stachybotrys elegans TaxID=80388 RepID=A0A8K0T5N3_9HYPO|nr:extracellular cell wall glucanase Crf1 [Stachybotrys elegans]
MITSFSRAAAAALAAFLIPSTHAQTFTDCNPLHTTCPANTALGMAINVDFTQGEVNSFVASGTPTYNDDGVAFTVTQGRDAPQLNSLFYIMFGRVEITMKAAPGAGIVSSLVLESDTLDEIDIEWLGSNPDEMQSNYFGKGQTTSYNRGQFHAVQNTQTEWITYTIDWTQDRIVWMAGGTVVREMAYEDAEENQYPQTPMQIKFGAWAGGDPNFNAPGTVEWARGPTDYSQGPFSMLVQRIIITDYSTGSEYRYGDNSGSWESIQSEGGEINGNEDNRNGITVTATAVGTVATSDVAVPIGGIAEDGSPATATQTGWPWVAGSSPTGGTIPSGWIMTEEGKIMPNPADSPAARVESLAALMLGALTIGVAIFANKML